MRLLIIPLILLLGCGRTATGDDAGADGGSSTCAQLHGVCQTTCSGSFSPIVQNGAAVTCQGGQFCCADSAAPTCASLGGACGGVSACSAGAGYLTQSTSDCTGASSVCCLPLSACGNQPEFDCCSGTGTFRPSCVSGQLVCTVGSKCGTDGGVQDCVNACPVGCAAPGAVCYSDGHDYCSSCVAACHGAVAVSCGG
jgi:hypothetical protein